MHYYLEFEHVNLLQMINNCQFVFTASLAEERPWSGVVVSSVPLL